jgi:hypothetical protein
MAAIEVLLLLLLLVSAGAAADRCSLSDTSQPSLLLSSADGHVRAAGGAVM